MVGVLTERWGELKTRGPYGGWRLALLPYAGSWRAWLDCLNRRPQRVQRTKQGVLRNFEDCPFPVLLRSSIASKLEPLVFEFLVIEFFKASKAHPFCQKTSSLVKSLAGSCGGGGLFAVVGIFDFFVVAFLTAADEAFGVALEFVPMLADVF